MPEVQTILVMLIVAGAAVYLARAAWRIRTGRRGGCGTGCGAAAPPEPGQSRAGSTMVSADDLAKLAQRLRRNPESKRSS